MAADLPPVDPPAPKAPEVRTRSPIWMRVLLVVSLAANLAIAGIVAGVVFGDGPPVRAAANGGPGQGGVPSIDRSPITHALSREDRGAIRREVIKNRRDARALRNELRSKYQDLLPLLRAETFDRAAFEAALAAQRAAAGDIHGFAHTLVTNQIATLTAEERAAMADRLEAGIKRAGKRPRKDGRPPKD